MNFIGEQKDKEKKGSVDEGDTCVASFWRWPGVLDSKTDVDRIANHFNVLPTLADFVGGSPKEQDQLHGLSLGPLLKDAKSPWEDRFRVIHKGRWKAGQAANSRGEGFAVRSQEFRLVGSNSLFDMEEDPSRKTNIIANHPELVKDDECRLRQMIRRRSSQYG